MTIIYIYKKCYVCVYVYMYNISFYIWIHNDSDSDSVIQYLKKPPAPFLKSESLIFVEKIQIAQMYSQLQVSEWIFSSRRYSLSFETMCNQMPLCCRSLSMSESPAPRQPAGITGCQDDVRRLPLGNLEIMTQSKNRLLLQSAHSFKFQTFKLLLHWLLFSHLADAFTNEEYFNTNECYWTFSAIFYCSKIMPCSVLCVL